MYERASSDEVPPKAGREHRVRLCSRAIKIVDEARRLGIERTAGALPGVVFPSQRGKPDRRRQTVGREVIEAALAHVVRNQTEAAYARSDLFARRRRLMNDWMHYLNGRRQ